MAGIGVVHAVADVVVDGDGPTEAFEAGNHFATEPVPEGAGLDAPGIGKPDIGGVRGIFAGFDLEEEFPRGIGTQGGKPRVGKLARGGVFRRRIVADDGGRAVRADDGGFPRRLRSAEGATMTVVFHGGGGGDPFGNAGLAERLEEQARCFVRRAAGDVEVEGRGGRKNRRVFLRRDFPRFAACGDFPDAGGNGGFDARTAEAGEAFFLSRAGKQRGGVRAERTAAARAIRLHVPAGRGFPEIHDRFLAGNRSAQGKRGVSRFLQRDAFHAGNEGAGNGERFIIETTLPGGIAEETGGIGRQDPRRMKRSVTF